MVNITVKTVLQFYKYSIVVYTLFTLGFFRVAYTANISEHLPTQPWEIDTKTRPQHRELRPLLFANSEWVL